MERLVMDPAIEGREALDITDWMTESGADYGDAAMEPYRAQAELGESVIDFRLPNRMMSIPLIPRDQGGTTFATFRAKLQAKTALWQREGGVLGRYNAQGTASVNVVAAGLVLGGDTLQARSTNPIDTNAVLELEAMPGWEEAEVELSSHEEKTLPELVFTETNIRGDMPARVRMQVEEKQGADQRGLIWGYRSRYYSSATTAKPAYSATELQPLGEAAKEAVSGAFTGTAVCNTTLPPVWTPVVGTNIGSTAWLTHKGNYRAWARLRSPQGTAVSARFVWDTGDLVYPSENTEFTLPAASSWFDADLGEVHLQPSPTGVHRWQGQIQARGTEGGEDINVDRVWLINTDEGMGLLTSPAVLAPGLVTYAARDEFNQSAGTLGGKTLPSGGTWTTSGATTDFAVSGTGSISRSTKLDALQRTAQAPGTTAKAVAIEFVWSALPSESSNTLSMRLGFKSAAEAWLKYSTLIGISSTLELAGLTIAYPWTAGARYTVCVVIRDAQWAAVWVKVGGGEPGGSPDLIVPISGTGGAAFFTDFYDGNQAITRTFDNFRAWVPAPDSVVFASQKVQLATEGMYRLDSGGTAYGPVTRVVGDLPRIPPTMGGRTTEVFIKASRGDLDRMPDSGIDDIAARVFYKPTWLTFPGS